MKSYERTYIRTLLNIATNLNHGMHWKHAAMLTDGRKIVSIGVNKAKSDPLQKKYSKRHTPGHPYSEYLWIHAEVDCLKNVRMDFKRSTLYVIRADSKGNLLESCPCVGCQSLINELRIPRILHSTADGKIVEINRTIHSRF